MTAGHSPANPALSEAIVTATDGFARQVWPYCSSLGVVFDRFHAAVLYLDIFLTPMPIISRRDGRDVTAGIKAS